MYQFLVWLILCRVLFVSTWLIWTLSLIISCCLLLLGEFASFCSRAFRCSVKLLVYGLSSFFLEALRVMTFPLRNAFILYHKFGYVVVSFSLNSKKSLISLFLSSLTKESVSWVLFGFHVNVGFLEFMWLLKISLGPWWSDRMHRIISIFFVSVEACFVTNYIVNFGGDNMWRWEEGISICFRTKCSVDNY